MSRRDEAQRRFVIACSAGFFALATNLLSLGLDASTLIPLGNIPLLIIAGIFGPREALWAVSIAYIPQVALTDHFGVSFRSAVIVLLSAYLTNRVGPHREFTATVALWSILFFPLSVASIQLFGSVPFLRIDTVIESASADLVISLVAGSLLLNESLVLKLTRRPFSPSVTATVFHVMALMCVVSISIAHFVPEISSYLADHNGGNFRSPSLYVISLALLLIAPSWISNKLSARITSILQERFSRGLLSGRAQNKLSGLTGSFWRNRSQSSTDVQSSGDSLTAAINRSQSHSFPTDSAICTVDSKSRVTFSNRKFRELFPTETRDPLGLELSELNFPKEIKLAFADCIKHSGTEGRFSKEVKISDKSEKLRYFEISLIDSRGSTHPAVIDKPGSHFLVLNEITERRTIESHLLKVQHMNGLGEITRSLSHSLSEMTDQIIDRASIAGGLEPKESEDNIREIRAIAIKIGDNLRKLTNFSSDETGTYENRHLGDLVNSHLPLIRELLRGAKKIEFHNNVVRPMVRCDANLMIQALTNLTLNSRDAFDQGAGEVDISLDYEEFGDDVYSIIPGARPGKFFRLRFQDNGIGMQPEVLAKACDPLFSTKRRSGHVGLGLSTVFAITRAHDGFLTIESSIGKGTSVSLYFPILEEISDIRSPLISECAPVVTSQLKSVLIVEDEEMIRSLVEMMLSSMGYEVTSSNDPLKALAVAEGRAFDLLVVDLVMPKMDGNTFAQRVKELHAETKVLVMSGYGDSCTDSMGPVLNKPFDLETLQRAVKGLIGEADCRL